MSVSHLLKRCYATRFLVLPNRGLKSTATVMPSRREVMHPGFALGAPVSDPAWSELLLERAGSENGAPTLRVSF